MRRLFVAIPLIQGEGILQFLQTLQSELSPYSIKWVNTDSLHITLAFIGDTHQNDVSGIVSKLHQSSKMVSPFRLNIQGLGFFGEKGFPTVIWAGIHSDVNNLQILSENINKSLGIKYSHSLESDFKPHLTLARIRYQGVKRETKDLTLTNKLNQLIAAFSELTLQKLKVNSFELMESKLQPQGAVYNVIERFELK
jgi:RNA 2',3'-cyclic 3'-phosphodiesterase